MSCFDNIYFNKKVLITGNTGFKGSWLSLWLAELGAKVVGISLPPETKPNHWELLNLPIQTYNLDIRNLDELKKVFLEIQPEVVFHLAAQPLVRRSYLDPVETWSTNVMGTVNVLEACRNTPSVQAILAVTTDKCYENLELSRGYREDDRLGGHDPYSASKAGAELVSASYRSAFFNISPNILLATARAGNVIGGGDWSDDRLVPDLVRAVYSNNSLEIRSPNATRPWQHVLESLSGYLLVCQKLLQGEEECAEPWNFGPDSDGSCSVEFVLKELQLSWPEVRWHITNQMQPHEANLLHLDSSRAKSQLGWMPIWDIKTTLSQTADWYRSWALRQRVISRDQLSDYISTAQERNVCWVK